jgi:phenylpropionate dioxygenase-like ring-hydroxylating dioxygenase large terminal subunit
MTTEETRWARGKYRGYDVRLPAEPDYELTQVDAGTPGGEYLRRFWTPVAMSSQLGKYPVPVRIFGEDLVVFRDGEGNIGLMQKACAHRRASLEFGRIESRGIRCCYHGWHFDVDGTILETPGEPASSNIRHSICQPAYPTREIKGLVFAYMGPPDEIPEFPYLDAIDLPDHELIPYSIHSPCNWLQETENAIDPFHSVFLHGRVNGPQFPGLEHFVELPVVNFIQRDSAIVYSHARRVGDLVMLRFHDYLMPNLAQNGGMFQKFEQPRFFGRTSLTKWVVPLDNTNSRKFGWRHFNNRDEVLRLGNRDDVGWEKVDFYGQTAHRSMEERQSNPGDWDVWASQGPVAIHAREYLGKTDEGIAMLRRKLRRDIRAVARGEKIAQVAGTKAKPFPTYGGDTVLKVAKSNDDEGLMKALQKQVAEIYFAHDGLLGEERSAKIKAALGEAFPDSKT